ncbi:hypothetical protein DSL72_000610 [Monilinia vaccinii-corymbosi]|uniref:Actin-like ATPase domain-containing protein n=1 Tax=Monilinia vaccinii-corymbosi TaxID=61207 RepID=A0A8A3P9N5_9HELO|nr:hypothetical protein DSL72_000610 [Monilinia vaccinii-corymbosi]
MPPFKDEHILIIAPGSQTTLAQLGLPESFTPPQRRFPTRMFLAPDGKSYEPYKIRPKKKDAAATANGDTKAGGVKEDKADEEEELEEVPEDDEGAIWPLKEGRIENLPAFCAFLHHIHNQLSPTLHTPIMLIAQPVWTAKNHEDLTQFIFEKFRTPALCIMDSALATSYAYGIANSTVIDVGFEKVDVTAVTDFQITARGNIPQSGGEAMTLRLQELLKSKGFTRDMAEQLKKSPICEILTPGTPLPGGEENPELVSNPAAAASAGGLSSEPNVRVTEAAVGPGHHTEVGEEDPINDVDVAEEDGVLDVASIVASGKTQEYLAKIEKEKAGRALKKAQKDKEAADAAAAKPVRLPNSKRLRATFHYESSLPESNAKRQKTPESVSTGNHEGVPSPRTDATKSANPPADPPAEATTSTDATATVDGTAAREQAKTARRQKAWEDEHPDRTRRDIDIGLERFQAASESYMDAIADTVYRTILSVDDISKRQDAWDSLIICGSGSKVRGFKDALIATLNGRYIISPSSATMFMSELPSNLATPSGTGSMTPNASFSSTPHPVPSASAVNPLLLAATTASNPALNPNMSIASFNSGANAQHSSHSQSPTSIKVATPPGYFPEWKTYEEAVFLGSQIAAKVIFVVDQGLSKGFLSRVDFNEEGPTAIHQVADNYITMLRRFGKATAKATDSKPPSKNNNIVEAIEKICQPEGNQSVVTSPVDRMYKTVTLKNDDIEDGLWMIRKLGNAKYEAVNLANVAYEDISSQENETRMASVPESVEVFKACQKSLGDVAEKLDRAVFTASGKVFRFTKLPIELRCKIYEFALISDSGSSLYPQRPPRLESRLALGLLATCRSINAECTKFLWKNTFDLSAPSMKSLKIYKEILVQNIRHVKCSWTGSYSKDMFILGMITNCQNLESLEIKLGGGCVERPNGYAYYTRKPQHLYQDDNSIRKFSRTNGFDRLVSLRHLKNVVVTTTFGFEAAIRDGTVTEAEVKTFEKFLRKKLTTPPPPPPPVALPVVFNHLAPTPTRQSTRIQKLKGIKRVKYVPDPASDDEDMLDEAPHKPGDDEEPYEDVMSISDFGIPRLIWGYEGSMR